MQSCGPPGIEFETNVLQEFTGYFEGFNPLSPEGIFASLKVLFF